MKTNSRFALAAGLLSLLLHAALFTSAFQTKKILKRSASGNRMEIDLVRVAPNQQPKKASPSAANKAHRPAQKAASALKGEANPRLEYLRHIRRTVVANQEFPYQAEKLKITARYRLKLLIEKDGSFAYSAGSPEAHPVFERAIQKMFAKIGKFRSPKNLGPYPMRVEFDLEFSPL